jgi:hypothetical protein
MSIIKPSLLACALALCLVAGPAQAKSHLSRDEIKILSATSVAVVYIEDQPLRPYVEENGGSGGVIGVVIGDAIAQRHYDAVMRHITPYKSVIDSLGMPEATQKAT